MYTGRKGRLMLEIRSSGSINIWQLAGSSTFQRTVAAITSQSSTIPSCQRGSAYELWEKNVPALNFTPIALLANIRRPVQMVAITGVPHITARQTSCSG